MAVCLGIYRFLIVLEVFGWNLFRSFGSRHLLRSYSSMSDLISWSCSSKPLLSSDGDAFDINMLDRKKTEQWYMNARLMSKLDYTSKDLLMIRSASMSPLSTKASSV